MKIKFLINGDSSNWLATCETSFTELASFLLILEQFDVGKEKTCILREIQSFNLKKIPQKILNSFNKIKDTFFPQKNQFCTIFMVFISSPPFLSRSLKASYSICSFTNRLTHQDIFIALQSCHCFLQSFETELGLIASETP